MASGLFALLDDIAVLADDVAVTTKMATTKTVGILGDDLAVNAQKATGFEQHRELIVLWAITKGSLKNKIIILPIAFLLSAFTPFLIPIILVLGGFYLLYEGVEKILEYFHKHETTTEEIELTQATDETILEIEQKKIKNAILTDFILSIEIVILALGTVLKEPLIIQIVTTTIVALIATFSVYGIVALIVRMDNIGFWLIEKNHITSGNLLIATMPKVIKILSAIGTIAMILVGGGILAHNIDFIHHLFIVFLPSILNEFLAGLVIGFIVIFITKLFLKFKNYFTNK